MDITMAHPTTEWKMDPEHVNESVRALADCMGVESPSVLLRVGADWFPLLESQEDRLLVQEWDGDAEAICVGGETGSTTLHFLDGVAPGLVRVRREPMVDGVVVYVGERAILAVAGDRISSLPDGLLHLDATRLCYSSIAKATRKSGRSLRSLDVSGNPFLTERYLGFVEGFPRLLGFDCSGLEAVGDLSALRRLSFLRRLSLEGCVSLCDLSPLSSLHALTHLNLAACVSVEDLEPLSKLPALVSLNLAACNSLKSLDPLCMIPQLSVVGLADCSTVPDIAALARIPSLQSLDLAGCSALTSVGELKASAKLRTLSLTGCSQLRDLHALVGCSALRSLELDDDVMAARVLVRCAIKREDKEYIEQFADVWLGLFNRVHDRAGFVGDLLRAFSLGLPEEWAVQATESLIDLMKRAKVEDRSAWNKVFAALRMIGDPGWCSGVERALENLDQTADLLAILEPASILLASATGEHSAAAWARLMADTAMDPFLTAQNARAVAPAAIRYYARAEYPNPLEQWIEVLTRLDDPADSIPSTRLVLSVGDHESIEDKAAMVSSFARLVRSESASPLVGQVVSALIGAAGDDPDCAVMEPFVEYFVDAVQRKPASAAAAKLWGSFDRVLEEQSDAPVVTQMLSSLLAFTQSHRDHAVVEELLQVSLDWAVNNLDKPSAASLTEIIDAARDAGIASFGRAVLYYVAMHEHDVARLEAYTGAFDLGQARWAMVRGLLEELRERGVVGDGVGAGIMASIERDIG